MVKQNFLNIMKWIFLGALVYYIWTELKEKSKPQVENYDDVSSHEYSQLDTPINQILESVNASDCQTCK